MRLFNISLRNFIARVVILLMFVTVSCKKDTLLDDGGKPLSIIPFIELTNHTPTTVKENSDSIIFHIKYTDGDGDIGFESADSAALYLTDNRAGLTEKYHVRPLAPIGDSVAIQGILRLKMDRTIILGDSSVQSETTTYTIKIRDRVGHWSNEVTSGSITITR